jgi:8-oxo-dGTP pyrophosphatase MutT (NUDIX family)
VSLLLSRKIIASYAEHAVELLAELGIEIETSEATALGSLHVLAHEAVAHFLQAAHAQRTGQRRRGVTALARDTFAAALSTPMSLPADATTNAVEIETERFAEGLAHLLVAQHIASTYSLTAAQTERLPQLQRRLVRQNATVVPDDRLGYLHYHDPATVRAILGVAGRRIRQAGPRDTVRAAPSNRVAEQDGHGRDRVPRIDDALPEGLVVAESGQNTDLARSGPPGVASPIAPRAPPAELLERLRATDTRDPAFWGPAGQVLELIVRDGAGRSGDARADALQRIAETLQAGGLRGGRELADDYLRWIAPRLGSPSWLAKWWPSATLPARIALGVLVALVGAPDWLRALPKKRRDARDLVRLIRLWTDQDLADHAAALVDVLDAASPLVPAKSELYGTWLRLADATALIAVNSGPDASSRVLDALRSLPGAINASVGVGKGNVLLLLTDATDAVTATGTGAALPAPRTSTPEPRHAGAPDGWTGTVTLYHGTNDHGAARIRDEGIRLAASRAQVDFGRGFYTTQSRRRAEQTARQRTRTHRGAPVVLRFEIPAAVLNDLSGRNFPGADHEYQEFVRAMRTTSPPHDFDWVRGPVLYNVLDFLAGGEIHAGSEQISFHTPRAVQILTAHLVEERIVQRSAGRNRIDCPCGESHWGLHGAAGLLLWHRDGAGSDWFLLQQRARSDYAGTWGLLGGARESGETAEQAVVREVREEGGLDPAAYTVLGAYLNDHGGWGFTTLFAEARSRDLTLRRNRETARLEWVRRDRIHTLDLHPGLAGTWNALMQTFLETQDPP